MTDVTTNKDLPRKQCAKCPWRKGVDPNDIPNGYSREKHEALSGTIAEPGSLLGLGGGLRMMACHDTSPGREKACVGWLVNQLGPGNNLALRMQAILGQVDVNVETIGEQRDRFEDTLPKRSKRAR
jgi:hypothetical protein